VSDAGIPDWANDRLGQAWVLDTNAIDDSTDAMGALRTLDDAGWINLTRTDMVDAELSRRSRRNSQGASLRRRTRSASRNCDMYPTRPRELTTRSSRSVSRQSTCKVFKVALGGWLVR
jgi:hypothetical protein